MSNGQERSLPERLWLIRHGESAGNVARDAAEAAGVPDIVLAHRDADVPLSELGEHQSRALGRWFEQLPAAQQPTVVITSPYVRARQTSVLLLESAQLAQRPLQHVVDERLRERELGILNQLTAAGIKAKFAEEAELRQRLGKFYYRPPGGESWCDVVLRLRSVWAEMQLQFAAERVLLIAHQAVVLCFRYVLERMTEEQILAIDREKDIANCGVTLYERTQSDQNGSEMSLRLYNFVTPLEQAGEPVTKQPDAASGAR